MLHLALDFGNTSIKAGSFLGKQLQEIKTFLNVDDLNDQDAFVRKHSRVIIGSVTEDHHEFIDRFGKAIPIILFTSETHIPLNNMYQTGATLGSDRLAASIGAYALYPDSNVLCIDCGTCIKYNFVNAKNEYLGGGISPGLQMRFKSLEKFTNKLPLVNFDEEFTKLIGQNTNESILSGVINGSIQEIEGIIGVYVQNYPNLKIVITGGDGNFFAKHLKKNGIFTHPNLVLGGLNTILNYTLEKK